MHCEWRFGLAVLREGHFALFFWSDIPWDWLHCIKRCILLLVYCVWPFDTHTEARILALAFLYTFTLKITHTIVSPDILKLENDVVYVIGRAFQDGKPTHHPNPTKIS